VDSAEGWYLDPFERHEQRWFSNGRPTSLVRDGVTTTSDDPPAASWDGPLREPEEIPARDETRRADEQPPPSADPTSLS